MSLGAVTSFAFAEPPIQPGDTLESLSRVKIETTVNGQAGSLEQMGITKEIIAQAISQNAVIDLQTRTLLPINHAQPSAVVEPQVTMAPMNQALENTADETTTEVSTALTSTPDMQGETLHNSASVESAQQVEQSIEQHVEQAQAQPVDTLDTAVAQQQAQVAANAQHIQAAEHQLASVSDQATEVTHESASVVTDVTDDVTSAAIPVEVQQAVEAVNTAQNEVEQVQQDAETVVNASNVAVENINQPAAEVSAQSEPVAQTITDEVAAVEAQVEAVDSNAQAVPANLELPDSSAQLNEADVGTVTPLQ